MPPTPLWNQRKEVFALPEQFLQPGEITAMSASAAAKLVEAGNGDAALLYLAILLQKSTTLSWPAQRLDSAYAALISLRLLDRTQVEKKPAPPPDLPMFEETPSYSAADINQELSTEGSAFPGLTAEVEKRIGKPLSTADLKLLYTLYDYLALPPEVIFLLVNWCIEEHERKYGEGRRPRLSSISRQGFSWKSRQIDTVEAAEEFLRRKAALLSCEGALLAMLDIHGRKATDKERSFLESWVEMGFPEESIRLAYERTLFQKQNMNWNYMNSILVRWHRQDLHTPEAIAAGDAKPGNQRGKPRAGAPQGVDEEAEHRAREDMERLRAYMKRQSHEGGT